MREAKRARSSNRSPASPMPEILLKATPQADLVTVPARTILGLEGQGAPGGAAFQAAVAALYGVAYTLKFARKRAGRRDFKIGALEALWWAGEGEESFATVPRARWRWQLRLAVPDEVDARETFAAIAAVTGKKGGRLHGSAEAARVELQRLPAGRWGRVLHVGPYTDEGASIAKVMAAIEQAGARAGREHVEIYLNDPRRTPPERWRTVLLHGLAPSRRGPGAVQARDVPARRVAAQDLHFSVPAPGHPLVR